MNKERYENIYYFQFKDFFSIWKYNQVGHFDNKIIKNPFDVLTADEDSLCCFFGNICLYSQYMPLITIPETKAKETIESESDIVRTLISKFILPIMWEKYVVRSKQETIPSRNSDDAVVNPNRPPLENYNADVERFLFESEAFINETLPYYKTLIEKYSSLEENLINQLGVHNVVKFNDMPQTEFVSTDDHLTNITDTKSEEDLITNMERLREIQDNLKRIYSDWTKEYEMKFAIILTEE